MDNQDMTFAITHPQNAFSGLLRTWRSQRRLSQLQLAFDSGLSQRHISFLETGRSKPSRYAVAQLCEALEMPAAEVDAMLVSAGFAARSSNQRWSVETRAAIEISIDHVLQGHEPFPALSIDRLWNLQKANASAEKFFARAGSSGQPNLLLELMTPGPLRENIVNWADIARALYRLLDLEVARRPNDQEGRDLLKRLANLPGVADAISRKSKENPAPVLTIIFDLDGQELRLFSLIATVGMSTDAIIDDLRIETLLPADENSRNWFETEI